jgi:hypothetical protein
MAFLLTGLAACKKTIDYTPLERNHITQYQVVNLQDTVIYGSIDNIQNTITVYVPYYYAMTVIQPKIAVDAGATLTTQILPVSVTDNTQTYTVKGADGTTRVYKLIITQQNPPGLSLQWLSSPPTNIPGGELDLTGNFLSTSTATLKITLQSTTSNTVTNLDISQAQIVTYPSQNTYLLVSHTPMTLDSGSYKVNVNYLGNNVTMDQPVHVYYPAPVIAPTYDTQTLAAGDSLKFLVAAPNYFHDLKSVTVTIKGQIYNIPVKSFSLIQVVITIPDTLPTGNWGSVPFTFQFGNFKPVTTTVQLIVKAKTG